MEKRVDYVHYDNFMQKFDDSNISMIEPVLSFLDETQQQIIQVLFKEIRALNLREIQGYVARLNPRYITAESGYPIATIGVPPSYDKMRSRMAELKGMKVILTRQAPQGNTKDLYFLNPKFHQILLKKRNSLLKSKDPSKALCKLLNVKV
jgi:hypothetical protein